MILVQLSALVLVVMAVLATEEEEPVAAAVLAWIILGEDLSGWQGVGAIAVLAGILLARRGSREAMGS